MSASASFQVDDIRDVYSSDLATFIADTRTRLARFVAADGNIDELIEPARNAHSMKGVSAMVNAWGLSWWGEDLEALYEVARSFFNSERDRANDIANFILSAIPRWEEMARLTLANDLDTALAIYRSIRLEAEEKWSGYLPAHLDFDAPVAEPVRLRPEAGIAGLARKAASPSLKIGDEQDEGTEAAFKPAGDAAGFARIASAPKFRVTEEEPSTEHESITPEGSAAGVARNVSKPTINVADESPEPPPTAENARIVPAIESVGIAREATPPNLNVEEEKSHDSELTSIFREEASGYLDELSVALGYLRASDSDEQWETTRRLSHTLKGSAAQVGLMEISEQAKTAEFIARSVLEEEGERGASRVADIIRAIEQVARLLGVAFKLVNPEEEPAVKAADSVAIDAELVGAFILDARDQIEQLERGMLAWERGESPDASKGAVCRAYHTLKGAANSIGMNALGANIHAVEGLIEHISEAGTPPAKELFTFLLGTVDQLRKYASQLERDPSATWNLDWNPSIAVLSASEMPPVVAKPKTAAIELAPQPDFDAELMRAVALDVRDQSTVLETAVIAWERGHDPVEQVNAAYRACHTLKGSANSVGLRSLGADFHALESLLDRAAKAGAPAPSPRLVAFLLEVVDQLARFSDALLRDHQTAWTNDWKSEAATLAEEFKTARTTQTGTNVSIDDDTTPVVIDTLRVDITRIHKLMNQVGELVVERNRFTSKLDRAVQLRQLLGNNRQRLTRIVENFQDQFEYSSTRQRVGGGARSIVPFTAAPTGGATDEFSELEFDRYDEFNMLSRQLTEVADDLGQVTVELERLIESFRNDEQRFAANSKVMQEDITGLTSQPIDSLFRRLDRIFRDAIQAEQKEAVLRFEGSGTALDRSIIERLYTPLLHLVRNAVAHGVEHGDDRVAAGKERAGSVTVSASQSSNQIVLTIRDDGRGIDPAKVLARAKERGLVSAEVTELSHEQTLHTIFTPGFSTATEVSSVAGRGVGLDVVKSEIEAMNGSVTAEWELGSGTTWRLLLPLSLAVTEAIIVGLSESEFAIPLNFTESGLLLDPHQIRVRDGVERYAVGLEELPLIRLGAVFGIGDTTTNSRGVIISIGDARCVLAVDSVPARREIVVKGFDPLLARHPLLEGATLDAEGRPVLILNAPALLRLAESGTLARIATRAAASSTSTSKASRERKEGERFTAMVVDDSLSVRAVQERLLGELGCEVVLATDGLDAIEKLRTHHVDMIFTDLEMPRMNGYDLISTVRLNPSWAGLPIVLVTSRAGQKHLDKAINLGCTDFLVKPFTQDDIARMLTQHGGHKLALVS